MDKKVAMALAFIAGVIATKNWSKIRVYVTDISQKTLSFVGLEEKKVQQEQKKKKFEKTKKTLPTAISEPTPT